MRCAGSPGGASVAPAGQSGLVCRARAHASRSTPLRRRTSIRLISAWRPNRSCTAAMSMTASGGPVACTLPATRTGLSCKPCCNCSGPLPSARRAAALRNTASGANRSRRPAWVSGQGIRSGATDATCRASTPTMRSRVRRAVASLPSALVLSSSTGEARTTSGWCRRRASTAGAAGAASADCSAGWKRNSRSGCPPTERTACENSSSADALIRCTENARATPSMTDTTAAALRHGWWRSSCQEKLVRRGHRGLCMGRLCGEWTAPAAINLRSTYNGSFTGGVRAGGLRNTP